MRFYNQPHRFYCGIDLHARTMHVCILDHDGLVVFDKNLPCRPESFLRAVAPFRAGLVVGVECMFAWYWLADLCQAENIAFVLGHALYMKAIHGGKAKNDKIDAGKIARLLRGGNFPLTYAGHSRRQRVCFCAAANGPRSGNRSRQRNAARAKRWRCWRRGWDVPSTICSARKKRSTKRVSGTAPRAVPIRVPLLCPVPRR